MSRSAAVWPQFSIKCFKLYVAVSRKRWEIKLRLLLIINRKWHAPFQIRWKSLTLDDLEGHWQPIGSIILATAELLVTKRNRYRPTSCFNKIECSLAPAIICFKLEHIFYRTEIFSKNVLEIVAQTTNRPARYQKITSAEAASTKWSHLWALCVHHNGVKNFTLTPFPS